MTSPRRPLLPLLGLLLALAPAGAVVAAVLARPNVFFIAIDDLRNDLGGLGAAQLARRPESALPAAMTSKNVKSTNATPKS